MRDVFDLRKVLKSRIPDSLFLKFTALAILLVATLSMPGSASSAPALAAPPYPDSPVIDRIDWDFPNMVNLAPGSDLWPTTWGPDDHQYTSWGDGGGFGGNNSDGRVSLGFARIEGDPHNFTTTNIWGGKNGENPTQFGGKTASMLSVDGTLYAWINTQNRSNAPDFRLAWSSDLGAHWQQSSWSMNSNDFAFGNFLNFGKDYQGARDGYVYSYGGRWGYESDIYVARVLKENIKNLGAYEYLSGFDGAGNPTWSSSASNRASIFSNPNNQAINPSLVTSLTYNPALGRYLLTTPHGRAGSWGIYDAPEPWGPWTTVDYYDNWGGYSTAQTLALAYIFSSKWMSADGLEMWLTFSGAGGSGNLDAFKLIEASVVLTGDPSDLPGPQPIAVMSANPTSGDAPLTVSFDGSASHDANGSIVDWTWDFGDGDTGSGESVNHVFANPGSYVVQLTVTDDEGNTDSDQMTIDADDPNAPVVQITNLNAASGANYQIGDAIDAGETVYIDRSYQYGNVLGSLQGEQYIVTANNDKTRTDSQFLTFDVDHDVEVLVAYDSRFSPPSWMSSFVDTGADVFVGSGAYSAYSKVFNSGTVSLGGNEGDASYSMYTVIVKPLPGQSTNIAPMPQIVSDMAFGDAPLTVTFDGSGSSDPDGSVISHEWDLDYDGNTFDTDATGANAQSTFTNGGSYVVALKVMDDSGASAMATSDITVSDPEPDPDPDPDPTPMDGLVYERLQQQNYDGIDDFVDTGCCNDMAEWTVAARVSSPQSPRSTEANGPLYGEKNCCSLIWDHFSAAFQGTVALRVGGVWHTASFGSLQPNVEYYMVGTYDGETLRAYKDGVLVDENGAMSGPPDSESMNVMIAKHPAHSFYFEGSIADIRIFDRALSDSEVAALYGGGEPPTMPTLPGMANPVQDLDGDGLAEDTNGDGVIDFGDLIALYPSLSSAEVQQNIDLFDFDSDGDVDEYDVLPLLAMIILSSPA